MDRGQASGEISHAFSLVARLARIYAYDAALFLSETVGEALQRLTHMGPQKLASGAQK